MTVPRTSPHFKIIVNGGPCADAIGRCLATLRTQTYPSWEALVTIDPWGDGAGERALEAAAGEPRIDVRLNPERRYAMANVIAAVTRSNAAPEDVFVTLDGDDWLATPRALEVIAGTYASRGCWATYGSWDSNDPAFPGRWPPYPDETEDFRTGRFLGTAVRTWKKWLFDRIDPTDLLGPDGRPVRVGEDVAIMLPIFEMAGTARAVHIPDVLMIYNHLHPYLAALAHRAELHANTRYLMAKSPYRRLSTT